MTLTIMYSCLGLSSTSSVNTAAAAATEPRVVASSSPRQSTYFSASVMNTTVVGMKGAPLSWVREYLSSIEP